MVTKQTKKYEIIKAAKKFIAASEFKKLSQKDITQFDKIIEKASIHDLMELSERLLHEIKLSTICISEGTEKDDR